MNRTIKEIQKAPRYQCKFTLHRVVKGKVACTGWSKFLHRAKNGTQYMYISYMYLGIDNGKQEAQEEWMCFLDDNNIAVICK